MKRLALNTNGELTYCTASEENIGKGRCNHLVHSSNNETEIEFMERTKDYFIINNGEKVKNLAKTNKAILKDHNQKAYMESKEALEKYGKCAIVQATGTGKSSIFTSIADDYNDEKCILICPLNGIKDQFEEHNKNNRVVKNGNLIVLSYSYIQQLSSLNALDTLDKKYNIKNNTRLIMLDELHRSGAEEWSNGIKDFINWAKKDENLKIVGASATPKRDDGSDPSKEFCGGIKVSNLSIEDAINKDILPMPKYIGTKMFSNDDFGKFIDKINNDKNLDMYAKQRCFKFIFDKSKKFNNLNELNESKIKINLENKILENSKNNKGTKILVFCETISDTKNGFGKESIETLQRLFPKQNILYSTYTSSSKGKEKDFYDKFTKHGRNVKKGDIEVLLTVNRFNEGIHAPDVETIFMGRKTKSNIIYSQQIGRVLTSDENAGEPLIFDFAGNFYNSNIDLEKLEINKNKNLEKEGKKSRKFLDIYNSKDYISTINEINAYIVSEGKGGRYKAGEYKGKMMLLDDIFLSELGRKPTKAQLNKFKIEIDKGNDFETAYNKSKYFC